MDNLSEKGGNIIRIKNALVLILALGLSASCATPYQQRTEIGMRGYYDYRETGNIYVIKFSANCDTDEIVVDRYLLRRAGEVCAAAGYSDYDVLDRIHARKVGGHRLPDWDGEQASTSASWNIFERAYECNHIAGMVRIVCTNEDK
jgi:hypothetical protein